MTDERDYNVWDALRRLRAWDSALADAMDEERGGRPLTEKECARLDAFLTGTGYLVSGRRVDPASVVVFRRADASAKTTTQRGRRKGGHRHHDGA